ncbi:hypothetical protein [Sorangium sp. So ce131]|uniref:hypothetical protein n=1 Tax=Sorangium sp. So ce131 TaxID=3133282 RepID=UPI003F5DBD28
MNRGFYLSLRVGSFAADPAPQEVIEALTEVQVSSSVGAQSGFQLKFTLGRRSLITTTLLPSGYFDPRRRVIISVVVQGTPSVLMDGIITKQDVTPSNVPGQSTLTITGLDLTALMDFIDLTGIPYPAMPLFAVVNLILAKYAVLGVIPAVIPNVIDLVSNPIERFMKHQGTDYSYVTLLARRYGHVFYLIPGPEPGQSLAYWGPELGSFFPTQPAQSIDLDAASNVDSLSFSYDGLVARQYIATILEENSKVPIPVPIPNIDILKTSLARKAPTPLKSELAGELSNRPVAEAALMVLSKLTASADAVSGNGQLDVLRYGHVLAVRKKVAVRGAGIYYDGLYNVTSVTHNIKRGEYKQSFSLKRDGVVSSISTVDT